MASTSARVLVADDSELNRRLLVRALEHEGYEALAVADGVDALAALRERSDIDAVLLDLVMPRLDGYEALAEIKGDTRLQHLPVIVITGVDELDSIVRCIELGAIDYLPKPFNASLLRARLNACLSEKRLRDLEREYLEEVRRVTAAAAAVETGTFTFEHLEQVSARDDALGQLARVFQRMASEVELREQRLQQRLNRVLMDLEERQRAEAETISSYIPMDRRQSLVSGVALPEVSDGTALFVDVAGFTALAAVLAQDVGSRRGAEELIRHLNRVFDVLIAALHRYGGSAVSFAGDAMTCWFSGDDGHRALAAAFAMLDGMNACGSVTTLSGPPVTLQIKVAVAGGRTRRLLVGDPEIQVFDVLAGVVLDDLARAERLAANGEVLVDPHILCATGDRLTVEEWRVDLSTEKRFAVVTPREEMHGPVGWPPLPPDTPAPELARPWLSPTVFERARSGKTSFLAELRPAAALFLSFSGIDYQDDADAGAHLDVFVRWVQRVLVQHEGTLLQVTVGDKGSYLYMVFGAPIAHEDDPVRAVAAAMELRIPPPSMQHIRVRGIGVTYGQMRAGAYGGTEQRTYGVQGEKTNLAAFLMQQADGQVLCDDAVFRAAGASLAFEALAPLRVKASDRPVPVYRPSAATMDAAIKARLDRLPPDQQLLVKIASVLGPTLEVGLLQAVYPFPKDRLRVPALIDDLASCGILVRNDINEMPCYSFQNAVIREYAYQSLLFAQRRDLHRAVATWYERERRDDLGPDLAVLADHWKNADEPAKAVHYLERAGQWAHDHGDYDTAERLLRASISLEASAGEVSESFLSPHKLPAVTHDVIPEH